MLGRLKYKDQHLVIQCGCCNQIYHLDNTFNFEDIYSQHSGIKHEYSCIMFLSES